MTEGIPGVRSSLPEHIPSDSVGSASYKAEWVGWEVAISQLISIWLHVTHKSLAILNEKGEVDL